MQAGKKRKGVMGCRSFGDALRTGRVANVELAVVLCSSVPCCAAMCSANDQSGRSALSARKARSRWPVDGLARPGKLLRRSPAWSRSCQIQI